MENLKIQQILFSNSDSSDKGLEMVRIYNQWYGLKLKELELAKKLKDEDVIDLVNISREMSELYKIYSNNQISNRDISSLLNCNAKTTILNCLTNLILAGASVEK